MTRLYKAYLIFSIFALLSCAKENSDCERIDSAPSEILDYYYNVPYTKWVYQKVDSPGVIDTVTLSGKTKEYYKPNHNDIAVPCTYHYRVFYDHSNSRLISNEFNYRFRIETAPEAPLKALRHISSTKYFSIGVFVKWPIYFSKLYERGERPKYVVSIADTNNLMTANGQFNNTIHTHIDYSYKDTLPHPEENYLTDLWISKGVGVTAFKFYDSSHWKIIHYE